MKNINPGIYRYFKGALVAVIGVGKHSETLAPLHTNDIALRGLNNDHV